MSFSVIIPARYASTRLPGKPLLDIAGKPMIQRVWEQARRSRAATVVIATDDARVADCAREFGADVCMTRSDHPSGTDRLQETAAQLGLADGEIVVNVQGDEPQIPAPVIDQVAENLQQNDRAAIATLAERITDVDVLFDPNVVKVVSDSDQTALYFSRAPIPWNREALKAGRRAEVNAPAAVDNCWRHVGIYAYRVSLLHRFIDWPPGRLESIEKLEQLRAMEQGVKIHVAPACTAIPAGIDTEADLIRVRQRLAAC